MSFDTEKARLSAAGSGNGYLSAACDEIERLRSLLDETIEALEFIVAPHKSQAAKAGAADFHARAALYRLKRDYDQEWAEQIGRTPC